MCAALSAQGVEKLARLLVLAFSFVILARWPDAGLMAVQCRLSLVARLSCRWAGSTGHVVWIPSAGGRIEGEHLHPSQQLAIAYSTLYGGKHHTITACGL